MIDYVLIGEQIRSARKALGWTQACLAERSGIEPSNISHIERGATKVSLPTLVAIANTLEVSVDELLYTNMNKSAHVSADAINKLLEDCNDKELSAITQIIKTTKDILRN